MFLLVEGLIERGADDPLGHHSQGQLSVNYSVAIVEKPIEAKKARGLSREKPETQLGKFKKNAKRAT